MKLNVSLFKKGDIDKAIRAVEKYQKSLVDRCEVFVRRLTDLGINVAMMTLATKGVGDAPRSAQFFINFTVGEDEVEGILSVTSTPQYDKDGNAFYPHLAWEFGAGNVFNGGMVSPNPKADELGLGIGSFPEQTHVPQPGFWYYRDENGDPVRSYGTQATMPMYKASIEILENIESVAREVFGDGRSMV